MFACLRVCVYSAIEAQYSELGDSLGREVLLLHNVLESGNLLSAVPCLIVHQCMHELPGGATGWV